MTNLELVLNMLAEASTAEISKKKKPEGLENNKQVARKGGVAAKKARIEIEKQTGESVITFRNAKILTEKQKKSFVASGAHDDGPRQDSRCHHESGG